MNLAFIPWNYRRSHPRVANFSGNIPGGCLEHPWLRSYSKESSGDTAAAPLFSKARASRARMATPRVDRSSLDNVMIFHRRLFHRRLKSSEQAGFLAAVNSTPFPVDDPPEKLRVRDLLSPSCDASFKPAVVHPTLSYTPGRVCLGFVPASRR
jgi:hypothetical protein